ncbi:TIGR00282 family metallophosphoesterase [Rhodopirellula halodulae]|uniref:TIGR00282 family metallophosphoesterase n=1 Tax=Rhodopirellula halodulae TaxID=2894198 RepID=UPI001E422D34|nr:TIGR00282 family metallophosphoesterase [Rhodopirellula sp. JC737]MCC9655534.1 YmdB family metallophosphoesterase [Rhodopirellula sp. JC737]
MRFLFLGDVVGKPGYSAVLARAADIRKEARLDAIIINAENAADGAGLMPRQYRRLVEAGVDVMTMGDHLYRRKEIIPILQSSQRIVRPANYPESSSGKAWTVVSTPAGKLGVISLLGRVFMRPVDCPFTAVDAALEEMATENPRYIFVDMHAEATSDKQIMGRYLDGRVTAVLGTHTHVPTADACILPGGTAFQCDVGMTGPYDSIIGRDIKRVTQTTLHFEPCHFHVATRDVRLSGAIVEANEEGKAISIERYEEQVDQ